MGYHSMAWAAVGWGSEYAEKQEGVIRDGRLVVKLGGTYWVFWSIDFLRWKCLLWVYLCTMFSNASV